MSLDLETVPETAVQGDLLEAAASPLTLSLQHPSFPKYLQMMGYG